MDQKEIDRLLESEEISKLNQEEKKIKKRFAERHRNDNDSGSMQKGEVVGEIFKVTEDSEVGSNIVLNYLENIFKVIEKQKQFLSGIEAQYIKGHEEERGSGIQDIIRYYKDGLNLMDNLVYDAMDAFQYEDIGRQKLMKVVSTLTKLNQYLNELLGNDSGAEAFGREIEKKSMAPDHEKSEVDQIIKNFQDKN